MCHMWCLLPGACFIAGHFTSFPTPPTVVCKGNLWLITADNDDWWTMFYSQAIVKNSNKTTPLGLRNGWRRTRKYESWSECLISTYWRILCPVDILKLMSNCVLLTNTFSVLTVRICFLFALWLGNNQLKLCEKTASLLPPTSLLYIILSLRLCSLILLLRRLS